MKKFTIILTILIALTIKLNAQIPNNGFENWTTVGSYEDPTGWVSLNSYSIGSFYPVTKSTDHYPLSVGSYSVRIENDTALLASSGMGWVCTGNIFEGSPYPTFPITGHPNSLTGYYKFAPLNGDTMTLSVHLFLNGAEVSYGKFQTTSSVSNWTSFNIALPAYTTADSGHINLVAWDPDSEIHGNSVLYVDNLNFDNLIISVSENTLENDVFNLYPNPASGIVNLNIDNINNADLTLYIYNVFGTLVKSETLKQNQRQINIDDLCNGVYIVTIKSKDLTENQRLIIQR